MAVAEAATLADTKRKPDTQSTPLLVRWQNKIRATLPILNDADEVRFVVRTLASSLNNQQKINIGHLARPSSWLDSTVQQLMLKILPSDETDRLPHLPWFQYDPSSNRGVRFFYAPRWTLLLDSVSDANVWEDQSAWNAMVAALTYTNDASLLVTNPIPGNVLDSSSPI